MHLQEAVQRLVDRDDTSPLGVAIDKLLLRLFEYPSLLAHLDKFNFDDETGEVELQFFVLPKEIVPQLQRILATDSEVYTYDVDGMPRTGAKIHVRDLGAGGDGEPQPNEFEGGDIHAEGGVIPVTA